jgi:hypothetical protein
MKKKLPIVVVSCVVLSALSITVPIMVGNSIGGKIDIHQRYIIPFVLPVLIILAVVRGERAIWPIIGAMLTVFYIGLHLVALP